MVKIMKPVLFIIFLLFIIRCHGQNSRKFEIDYENDRFLKDGEEFRYVAGSFHYFRAHQDTWQDKLRKMRAAGLNAVDIYVHWALHNPKDDVYNWTGIADVEKFIELATEEDLYIILRPGPYICAEIDNGGLPYWLGTKYPNIKVRTNNQNYLNEVEKWYNILMPKFEKHFYGNGGNIIMVQVENEYGAFYACDEQYKIFLRDLTLKFTHDNAVLFTTDIPTEEYLRCGYTDNVFATTDFGISSEEEVAEKFNLLRKFQPKGPLVNSEFYTGWLTHWQEPNARRDAQDIAKTLKIMLSEPYKANVNFYMFFGGTNFGYWAGANDWGIGHYMADITSYDYDAPLSEPGDLTPKYYTLRSVIGEYLQLPPLPLPDPSKKRKYDSINVSAIDSILSSTSRAILGSKTIERSEKLLTFEELDQFSGFVLYETLLPETFTRDPSKLIVDKLRDRALIYIDNNFIGILSRENIIDSIPITKGNANKKLQILVENQGRINFQENFDFKGILGDVKFQIYPEPHFKKLSNWTITGYPFDDYEKIKDLMRSGETFDTKISKHGILKNGPMIFKGNLIIAEDEEIADTWWNFKNWGKGNLFVNGHNMGRYWSIGPQMTLYVPKEYLKFGENIFVVLELQKIPLDMKIEFSNEADYNED